jgi:hypothetical protein
MMLMVSIVRPLSVYKGFTSYVQLLLHIKTFLAVIATSLTSRQAMPPFRHGHTMLALALLKNNLMIIASD